VNLLPSLVQRKEIWTASYPLPPPKSPIYIAISRRHSVSFALSAGGEQLLFDHPAIASEPKTRAFYAAFAYSVEMSASYFSATSQIRLKKPES